MSRIQLAVIAIIGYQAFLNPTAVKAQVVPPRPVMTPVFRPPVSPYLNLLRRGQSTALNYYNLVLPEVNFAKNIGDLHDQAIGTQRSITQLEDSNTLPDTGHRAQFMSHSRYFMNSTGGGGIRMGGSPATVGSSSGRTSSAGSATSRGATSTPSSSSRGR